jgi:RNA polymerase primary sigma factor
MTPERLAQIQAYAQAPISLDRTVGDDGDTEIGDLVEDAGAEVAMEVVSFSLLQDQLRRVLSTLTEREAGIVQLRFGLVDGRTRTLDEIGAMYRLTLTMVVRATRGSDSPTH